MLRCAIEVLRDQVQQFLTYHAGFQVALERFDL
jgi:hypothetical protein